MGRSRTEYYRLMGWTFRRSRSSTGVVQTYLSTTYGFERITPHLYKRLRICSTRRNSTCDEALNLARKERFERNKKNSSQTPPRLFKPGDKVYLSYPRGRLRPLHGSTKLSRVNDGPFTVLGDMFQGLVYNLKHDRKKDRRVSFCRAYDPGRRNGFGR